jgi:hypothetical protein
MAEDSVNDENSDKISIQKANKKKDFYSTFAEGNANKLVLEREKFEFDIQIRNHKIIIKKRKYEDEKKCRRCYVK